MQRWPELSAGCVLALAASAAMAAHVDLGPATQDAILAGAKACIGTTTDVAGTDARLAGWRPAPKGAFKTDGRALTRDHVLLAITPGRNGACVVIAHADENFRGRQLLVDLQRTFGAKLRSDAPPVLTLPNGELMRFNTGRKNRGPVYVQLALVNEKGN